MKSGRSIQDVSREILRQQEAKADYERKLVGVILYHHLANAYWPEGSEYDDNVPPFCQSFDGKQGYGEPGGVCAACAFNQFGSTANGSGKACKICGRSICCAAASIFRCSSPCRPQACARSMIS